jgi:hypothetical protein
MTSKRKFRHQDISVPGADTRVRTVRAGAHQIRIAFPKGARKRGSGKIVAILHPGTEKNPICDALTMTEVQSVEIPVAMAASPDLSAAIQEILESPSERLAANPADLPAKWNELRARLAAWIKPHHRGAESQSNPKKKRNYTEEVRSSSGQTIFINVDETSKGWRAEGYPVIKGKIRRVARPLIAYGDSEARAYDNLVERLDKNPRKCKGKKARRNLDEIERAAELAGEFRGYPAERITESGEPNKIRDDYAHLGWSEQFVFVPPSFHEQLDCEEISEFYDEDYQRTGISEKSWRYIEEELGIPLMVYDVAGDEIRLVASADGKQLYFLGGKQAQFKDFLSDFATDTNKDRVSLGVLLCITYSAQKVQAGDEEERGYYHVFGEEGGYPPGAYFDTLNDRIMLFGGTYHLEEAERGIIN